MVLTLPFAYCSYGFVNIAMNDAPSGLVPAEPTCSIIWLNLSPEYDHLPSSPSISKPKTELGRIVNAM